MKKHWLRGVLLGVSMALLLAGGVALAASLKVTVDQYCFECWPGPYDEAPPEEYFVEVTVTGFQMGDPVCYKFTIVGTVVDEDCDTWPFDPPYVRPMPVMPCERPIDGDLGGIVIGGEEIVLPDAIEDYYGEWHWRWWNPATGDSDEVTFLFAEDCAAATFVPEPGSIALLGSGLMGLAGYATLRWRSKE